MSKCFSSLECAEPGEYLLLIDGKEMKAKYDGMAWYIYTIPGVFLDMQRAEWGVTWTKLEADDGTESE